MGSGDRAARGPAPVTAQCQLTQIEVVYQSQGAFTARML